MKSKVSCIAPRVCMNKKVNTIDDDDDNDDDIDWISHQQLYMFIYTWWLLCVSFNKNCVFDVAVDMIMLNRYLFTSVFDAATKWYNYKY